MTTNAIGRLWAEPRAPRPPAPMWRDWVLVAVLVCSAVLEGVLREDVPWRPLVLVVAVALTFTLPWRRTHPLAMAMVAFGAGILLSIASLVSGAEGPVGLNTMVYVLVLAYALFRWGSGREAVIGATIILLAFVVGMVEGYTTFPELVAAFIFLWFPAVLGASVRFWRTSRLRELDQVRLREREQLARELHDTVAHHVSAMVVRAQAGRIVAATRPSAASEALEVIEAEGSRTLAEMRVMVGALRDGDDADLATQRGVADIERLASTLGDQPRVEVQVSGDLDDLVPAVGAAMYRIAQESLTNAMRHARHASRVVVRIAGDDQSVRITVDDDGDPVSTAWVQAGYGIVGMTERAILLGGTIRTGPGPERGWVVDAVFPRVGSAR